MFVRRGISSVFRATHNGLPLRGLHTKPLEELKRLGVELPETPSSPPSFVNCVRRGNRLYVSGHLPVDRDGNMIKGKVGKDVTTEQAAEAAKLCAINMISTIKAHVDNLDGIRVTKLFGLVNCVDGYTDHPTVINGCSDFFNEVFGKVKMCICLHPLCFHFATTTASYIQKPTCFAGKRSTCSFSYRNQQSSIQCTCRDRSYI